MRSKDIKEMNALISLVDDPDSNVFEEVAEKISQFGMKIIPFLESKWEELSDQETQSRIENIIHEIQFRDIKEQLKIWKEKDDNDLLSAWLIITQYKYPELNEEEIRLKISEIRKDIWLELNDDLTALEQIKVFNHIFYEVHGFTGDTENFYDPRNLYLKNVLENKKGNPLSLGLLYMIFAKSLDLPIYGVNLPKHFALAYTAKSFNIETLVEDKKNILFYINAFSKGVVFSQREAEWFLEQINITPKPEFFQPCSNREVLFRVLKNLSGFYEKNDELNKSKEINELYNIVSD